MKLSAYPLVLNVALIFLLTTPAFPITKTSALPGFIQAPQETPTANTHETRAPFNVSDIDTTAPNTTTKEDDNYPKLDTDGFIEYKFSGREYTTDATKLETVRNDPVFQKLPQDVQLGPPRLELRYLMHLEGQLDKDLWIYYNVQKEPDFPGKYNIRVKKNTTELSFGDQDIELNQGDFVRVKKSFNGVHFLTQQSKWSTNFLAGKSKSTPQKFETFGTGEKVYYLGKKFIYENSVRVYINNEKQAPSSYIIDYINGSVTFSQAPNKADTVKVIYEFTNPIEDFIPSLSNKSIIGNQFIWEPHTPKLDVQKIRLDNKETLTLSKSHHYWKDYQIQLEQPHVIMSSETILLNGQPLLRHHDYNINYKEGALTLRNKLLGYEDKLTINYAYYDSEYIIETLPINSSQGPFYFSYGNVIQGKTSIFLDGFKAREFIDYVLNYKTGTLYFNYPIPPSAIVRAEYHYEKRHNPLPTNTDTPYSMKVTYLEEASKSDTNYKKVETETITSDRFDTTSASPTIILRSVPIDPSKELQFSDETLADQVSEIDHYTGLVTFNPGTVFSEDFTISYQYITTQLTQFSFRGTGHNIYSTYGDAINPPNLPIKHNGVQKIIIYEEGIERYILNDQNSGTEYDIEYLEEGQHFKLTFYVGGTSQLQQLPQNNHTITIFYDYIPTKQTEQSNSSQKLLDIALRYDISKKWSIATELAQSDYDFSKKEVSAEESFYIANTSNTYPLQNNGGKPIIENSETVFVNGISRSVNTHYSINYNTGTLQFYESYPIGTHIRIIYDYFENTIPESKKAHAFKLDNRYALSDTFSFSNKLKYLNAYFKPIGKLDDTSGSMTFSNNAMWTPTQNTAVSVRHFSKETRDKSNDVSHKEHDLKTDISAPFYRIDTQHKFRHNITHTPIQQTTLAPPTTAYPTLDTISAKTKTSSSYSPTLSMGNKSLRTLVSSLISKQTILDHENTHTNVLLRDVHSKAIYTPETPLLFKTSSYTPFLGISHDKTAFESEEALTKKSTYLGLETNTTITDGLTNESKFEKKEVQFNSSQTRSLDNFYNFYDDLQFNPYYWLSSSYRIDHIETVGPIYGQEDKVEDRQAINIKRLYPRSLLKQLRFSPIIYTPFNNSYLTFQHQFSKKRENNALQRFQAKTNTLSLYDVDITKSIKLNTISFSKQSSDSLNEYVTQYQRYYESTVNSDQFKGTLSIKPKASLLKNISYKWTFRNYNSLSNSFSDYISSTSSSDNQHDEDTSKHTLSYRRGYTQFLKVPVHNTKATLEWDQSKQTDFNQTLSNNNTTTTLYLDSFSLLRRTASLGFTPYNRYDVDTSLTYNHDYYTRNKTASISGSLFKRLMEHTMGLKFSPFQTVDLESLYTMTNTNQYSSSAINIPKETLFNTNDKTLRLKRYNAALQSKYTPFSFMSFTNGLDYTHIGQVEETETITKDTFKVNKINTGVIWYLVRDLDLSYSYNLNFLKQNQDSFNGYTTITKLTYAPLHYKNYNIDISISKTKNWGQGFNEIENDLSQQASGEIIQLEIRDRDDSVLLTSINIQVNIELDNFRILEELILSGEGYFKTIDDKFVDLNNYDISGFYLKASILL